MNFGTENVDRMPRRILAAMIVCGAILTVLSFAMQMQSGAVKSRLSGLMSLVSSTETATR